MKLITRLFLGIIGTGGVLLSIPFLDLALDQKTIDGTLIFLLVMMVILTPSIFTLYKVFTTPRLSLDAIQKQENIERHILHMARTHKGRISADYVTTQTSLSLKQANRILEQLEKRGLIHSVITPEGGIEFIFPEFLETTTHALKASTDFNEFDQKLAQPDHILDHNSPRQESPHPQPDHQTTNRS